MILYLEYLRESTKKFVELDNQPYSSHKTTKKQLICCIIAIAIRKCSGKYFTLRRSETKNAK